MVDVKQIVRDWVKKDVLDGKDSWRGLSSQNMYNYCNLIAGFLQACEKFNHLTHEESQQLFKELTE